MQGFASGFLRLNLISALYALPFTIYFELGANYYRIGRLTGWSRSQMRLVVEGCPAILWLAVTVLAYAWTRRKFGKKRSRYISAILWLPYSALFFYAFASFFPITDPGDKPNPAVGLMLLGALLAYPVYVLIVNALAPVNWRNQVRETEELKD
ncbi:hypothetical protein ACLBWT_17340 [Paenibacillus sp. D51F]